MKPTSAQDLVQRLAWVLIYGGLISCVIGAVLYQQAVGEPGLWMVCGGVATVLGAGLIWLRSRMD